MNRTVSKFALTAGLVLAITFTLSCSGDDGDKDEGGGSGSSSSDGGSIQPLSSSSVGDNPPLSSSGAEQELSSSSGDDVPELSSSSDGDIVPSSSSEETQVGESSSSVGGGSIIYGSFTDTRDGKTYKTVVIGTQTWFAENLNYGDRTKIERECEDYDYEYEQSEECYYYINEKEIGKCYDNDPANCVKYGRLYTYTESNTVCPSGWNKATYPSKDYIGDEDFAGTKLKAKSGWNDYEGASGNGTDEFGFSALPGGYGNLDGSFGGVGNGGMWWGYGSSPSGRCVPYTACPDYGYNSIYYNSERVGSSWSNPSNLFSVRCVKVE